MASGLVLRNSSSSSLQWWSKGRSAIGLPFFRLQFPLADLFEQLAAVGAASRLAMFPTEKDGHRFPRKAPRTGFENGS